MTKRKPIKPLMYAVSTLVSMLIVMLVVVLLNPRFHFSSIWSHQIDLGDYQIVQSDPWGFAVGDGSMTVVVSSGVAASLYESSDVFSGCGVSFECSGESWLSTNQVRSVVGTDFLPSTENTSDWVCRFRYELGTDIKEVQNLNIICLNQNTNQLFLSFRSI
ncbi:hypothetical protein [Lysinibacter cavernae]|uniref:Uncharacterized protein n=1 Tax=Lysinibacter cavernae TaxID=1640652 RepID=A0A7X5TUW9_9MICO|nr:hypothetical protein [Lysinibacter cavernae]NIH54908.1 hypothetical protein [Lysinibacter cavernae]